MTVTTISPSITDLCDFYYEESRGTGEGVREKESAREDSTDRKKKTKGLG